MEWMKQVEGVVEDGQLRLAERLEIPDGRQVEVIINVIPTAEEARERAARMEAILDRLGAAAAELTEEQWAQFEADISASRSGLTVSP